METLETEGGQRILRELARALWPEVPVLGQEHTFGLRDFTDEDLDVLRRKFETRLSQVIDEQTCRRVERGL